MTRRRSRRGQRPPDPNRLTSEAAIVEGYLAPLAAGFPGALGLADDCALVSPEPGHELVLKTDPIIAGVHFFASDDPALVAWKALAVNCSDLAAKGARPVAYLMALTLPEPPHRDWMAAFAKGLAEAQAAFGCHLIGGDTDRSERSPLSIAITAIGTVPKGQMVRRSGARPGDRLLVTGTIGDAVLGLQVRQDFKMARAIWPSTKADHAYLLRRLQHPEPRLALAEPLRRYATAAMDISDGLVQDAGKLCRASGVAGVVRAADVPVSPAARLIMEGLESWREGILSGGEDYEILAAAPPAKVAALVAEAKAAGIPMTEVGEVVAGSPGLTVLDAAGQPMTFEYPGWDHFRE
jgi:thiamine-monophosphate kinase